MKIALDIGHSKRSSGASNKASNISEFIYNEKLVKEVAEKLENKGHDVSIIYRRTYASLPRQINEKKPDVVIAFHCNAFNEEASGSEVLYWHKSSKGKAMAKIMQKAIVGVLGLPNRGIKPKTETARGGSELKKVKAPIIIIEPFFIDNDSDLKIAQDKHNSFVNAIANAIDGFEV